MTVWIAVGKDVERRDPSDVLVAARSQAAPVGVPLRASWRRRWSLCPAESFIETGAPVRILLLEDDEHLARTLATGLRERAWEVVIARSYREGRERSALGTFGMMILDVMLPDGNGFELCRQLRKAGSATPILMLTARDAVDDRVTGLEAGADDYLVKPFALRELVARIEALTRRQPALTPERISVADLEVELKTRKVARGGRDISLTAKEFALLEFFVKHRGEVVDRAAITAHVWDENHDPFTNALEVLVRRLRIKIDDPFEPKLIQTLRGAGYRFGPP